MNLIFEKNGIKIHDFEIIQQNVPFLIIITSNELKIILYIVYSSYEQKRRFFIESGLMDLLFLYQNARF